MPMTRKKIAGPGFRGLLSTRQGALALAVLCALAATVILVFALGSYRKSVNTTVKQDTVLVATSLIPKGSSGDVIAAQQRFKATPVLAAQVSAGALSDSSFVRGKVAVSDILPGQQLTAADFTATAVSGFVAKLAPSQRAISISVDPSHGLGGVVQAGDHVDVYGSYSNSPTDQRPLIALVAADALVLAVPGAAAGPASTVLAVSIRPGFQGGFHLGQREALAGAAAGQRDPSDSGSDRFGFDPDRAQSQPQRCAAHDIFNWSTTMKSELQTLVALDGEVDRGLIETLVATGPQGRRGRLSRARTARPRAGSGRATR